MSDVYERTLQSLVGRHTATLCILSLFFLVLLFIIWGAPILWCKLKDKEIKNRALRVALTILFAGAEDPKHQKSKKWVGLIAQIVLTVILGGILMLAVVSSIQDIQLLKQDIVENSYITYEGEYSISSKYSSEYNIDDIWIDERSITLTDSNESVQVDASGTWKFPTGYSKSCGTVIYGKHSKRIIHIDGLNGFWE
ncbi:MAG: hypothetical protein IKV02_06415 [Clostridia bacterium]|nr:hypothetical protein [Clostridia bacterium]